MVKHAEYLSCRSVGNGVVQGRHDVQHGQRNAVNTRRDHTARRSVDGRLHDAQNERRDRQTCPDAVRNGIDQFFTESVYGKKIAFGNKNRPFASYFYTFLMFYIIALCVEKSTAKCKN